MTSKSKKRNKKTQKLLVFAALSAVILTVSTFAWFIGRQETGVDSFNIEVSAMEHLELSMNGLEWSDTITLTNGAWTPWDDANPDASQVYDTHTNSWGSGLVPVSSSGEVDTDASRLMLFEGSSFARTAGGYKVLSTQIDNTTAAENGDYVAFDLFIKNSSGTQYNAAYEPEEEEEIFLTYNSAAVVDSTGAADTVAAAAAGIENSLRVAFIQVGRIAGTSTVADDIQGMTCAGDTDAASTGICFQNRTTIWEPNDVNHTAGAIGWVADTCSTRVAASTDLLNAASYNVGTACTTIAADTYYQTYTIQRDILTGEAVDVYDSLNGYTPLVDVADPAYTAAVVPTQTFTDSDRDAEGDGRNPFMFLAPNSITKVRIYIYLEGMDLDNMDLAEVLNNEITLNFGFTKQQYETDTDFGGGSLDNGWTTVS